MLDTLRETARERREMSNNRNAFVRLAGEIRNNIYEHLLPPGKTLFLEFPFKSGGGNLPRAAISKVCRQLRLEASSTYYKTCNLVVQPYEHTPALPYVPLSLRAIPLLAATFASTIEVTCIISLPEHLCYYCDLLQPKFQEWIGEVGKFRLIFALSAKGNYVVQADAIECTKDMSHEVGIFQSWYDGKDLELSNVIRQQMDDLEEEMLEILSGREVVRVAANPAIWFHEFAGWAEQELLGV